MLRLGKLVILATTHLSFLSAGASCGGAACVGGQEDVTSLLQLHERVRAGGERSDEKPDAEIDDGDKGGDATKDTGKEETDEKGHKDHHKGSDEVSNDVKEVAAAKLLYKVRLAEREVAFNKFMATQTWSEARIAEGRKDLLMVDAEEKAATKAIEGRQEAARNVWAKAASEMLETQELYNKKAGKDKEKDGKDIVKTAEKYADEALKSQLQSEISQTKNENLHATVLKVQQMDLLNDEATLRRLNDEREGILAEVDMYAQAEEDVIVEKALADKKKKEALIQSETVSVASSFKDALDVALDKVHAPKSEEVIVLEAVGDIADRARMSLYGEFSERAIRLASSKMVYKKSLFLKKLAMKEFEDARKQAHAKIEDGKAALKRAEKKRREEAKDIEKNVRDARDKWEALASKMAGAADEDKSGKAKALAKMKGQHDLAYKLIDLQSTQFKEMVTKRTEVEKAGLKKQQAMQKDADKHSDEDWKELEKKVSEEVEAQEANIQKRLHGNDSKDDDKGKAGDDDDNDDDGDVDDDN